MKHENPIKTYRSWEQNNHGKRVEERQHVNGQPNGYVPVSEAELQTLRTTSFAAQYETPTRYGNEASAHKPAHGGYCGLRAGRAE
jgi:hypothetical protein